MNNLTIFLVLFTMICSVNAQQYATFDQLTIKDGLSQSAVLCILQDHRGFMWFGTFDGLNRYDGYEFEVYRTEIKNPNSLSSNVILSLHEDRSGILWIGTYGGGLNKYDRKKNQFQRYLADPSNPNSLSNNMVSCIYEDYQGILWIGTENGLNKFDHKNEEFTHYYYDRTAPASINDNKITTIFEDRSNTLWIGGGCNGFCKYDRENDNFKQYSLTSKKNKSIIPDNIVSICEDNDGNLWLASRNGLHNFDPKTGKFIHFTNQPNNLNSSCDFDLFCFLYDSKGNMWIGTDGHGICKGKLAKGIHSKNPAFINFQSNPYDHYSLSSDEILSLYEDETGVIWIGTRNGINKYVTEKQQFVIYKKNPLNPNSLSHSSVSAIYEDRYGTFWFGTSNGLNKFDPRKHKFIHYISDPEKQNTLLHNDILSIFEDNSGILWVGTRKGLNKYLGRTNDFKRYTIPQSEPSIVFNNDVHTIYEDHKGFLWIGTDGGLYHFDPNKEVFKAVMIDPTAPKNINGNLVWIIYEDSEGTIWIGTDGCGLKKFDLESGEYIHYQTIANDSNSISNNKIFTIYEDSSQNLWVGTNSGLNKLDKLTGTFSSYGVKAGLKNEAIYGILEDSHGNLWLSTNHGISKFNPLIQSFRNYDIHDGLQGNEFFINSAWKDKTGEMYFGGVNGLNIFHPDSIKGNSFEPKVVITDFQIFNQSIPIGTLNYIENVDNNRIILDKSITECREITLSHSDRVITFEFAALHFVAPHKNEYAYILENFEENWNPVNNRRYATYTNLAPGEYIFKVTAANNDDVWKKEATTLKIIVQSPYWKTWWFRSLTILVIILFIILLIIIRTHRITSRNKLLEKKVSERTYALETMNERLQNEIYERKLAEQSAKHERERLDVTLRSIADGVITTDTEGKVLLMNKIAESLTGWQQDEAFKKPLNQVFRIINQKTGKQYTNPVDRVLETGEIVELASSIALLSRNGNERIIADSGAPIKDKLGNIIGVVLVFRDITQRQKIDEELQKASKLESIGILAGGIAHDFNNILTAILSNISLAKLDIHPNQEIYNMLNEVENASLRAKKLTQQLLTFSKGGSPIKKTTSIKDIIVDSAQFALKGSNTRCQSSIPQYLWSVEADTGQISQVINNLIINAAQAMPNGGTVELSAENIVIQNKNSIPLEPGKYIKINIKDQGEGIPKEYLDKIFDPYFTTKPQGSGLGLTTSYSIIKNHDGFIDVQSNPGDGTTFNIYLPASTNEIQSQNEIITYQTTSKGNVLVMDDEEIILKSTTKMLKRLGYEAHSVRDGREALQSYKQALTTHRPFDIIIMDLTIQGGMGGKETIQHLLELDPNAQAIVSSGYSNDPIMANYSKFGFAGVICKPYRVSDLNEILFQVMSNSNKIISTQNN